MFSKDTTDAESSGLDVYDPTFEQDLNQLSDGSLSGTTEDFWFTTSGQITSTPDTSIK